MHSYMYQSNLQPSTRSQQRTDFTWIQNRPSKLMACGNSAIPRIPNVGLLITYRLLRNTPRLGRNLLGQKTYITSGPTGTILTITRNSKGVLFRKSKGALIRKSKGALTRKTKGVWKSSNTFQLHPQCLSFANQQRSYHQMGPSKRKRAYKNLNVEIYPILLPRYIIRRSRQWHTRAIQFDEFKHHSVRAQ